MPGTGRKLDLARYQNSFSLRHKIARLLWDWTWLLLYRPSPRPLHVWRRWLLRRWGARIARDARPYPAARIWAPWNLQMQARSCLADHVDCYNVAPVFIGEQATVSQYSYICTASHDFTHPLMPLTTARIVIENQVWIAADVFVGPGVTVGEGAVVGARSSVFGDIAPWQVAVGSPARPVRRRVIRPDAEAEGD